MNGLVLSIDPGNVHNGMSYWSKSEGLWTCIASGEVGPGQCVDQVKYDLEKGRLDCVCIEGFWLRNSKALQQTGSDFIICEVIGTVKNLCRWSNLHCRVSNATDTKKTHDRLEAAGYRYTSRGHGIHAKDSEAVGVRGLRLRIADLKEVPR